MRFKFERSAAFHQGTDLKLENFTGTYFLQYVGDNVDYNKLTLTGEGTFHGMGIIVNVTPRYKYKISVPRLTEIPTSDLLKVSAIASHVLPTLTSAKVKFHTLPKQIYEPKRTKAVF